MVVKLVISVLSFTSLQSLPYDSDHTIGPCGRTIFIPVGETFYVPVGENFPAKWEHVDTFSIV